MGTSAPPAPPLPAGVAGALGIPVNLCMSPRQAASSSMAGAGVPNYFDPALPAGGSHGGGSDHAAGDGGVAVHARGGGGPMHFPASPGLSQHRFRDLHTSSHLPPAVADHGRPAPGRPGRPPVGPTMVSLLTDQPVTGFGAVGGPDAPPRGMGALASSVAAPVTVAAAATAVSGAAASAKGHTGLDDARACGGVGQRGGRRPRPAVGLRRRATHPGPSAAAPIIFLSPARRGTQHTAPRRPALGSAATVAHDRPATTTRWRLAAATPHVTAAVGVV